MALVEDEVDDGEHGAEPVGQLVVGRDFHAHALLAQRALGAHEPLRDRGRRREQRPRDLLHAQAADEAQRERDARLGRERRMAAREHEAEPLVGYRRVALGLDRAPQRLELHGLALALARHPPAAQPVDGAIARRADDPGTRVVWQAVARPALQRRGERVLDDLLGEVEVADAAREDSDGPPEPLPVEPADRLALQRRRRAHICATGRTSIAPKRALGMREAASMAWSSVAQSTT